MRFALWRGDHARMVALRDELARADAQRHAPAIVPFVELVIRAVDTDTAVDPLEIASMLDTYGNRGSGRRLAFFRQIGAEACARLGLFDTALGHIQAAIDCGLIDVLWLDRCAVFEELRRTAGFAPLRAQVAARVGPVVARAQATTRGEGGR